MRSKSSTTGLVLDASRLVQDKVVVLSDPEQGGRGGGVIIVSGSADRSVALCSTTLASLGSELVIFSHILGSKTKALVMPDENG